MSQTATKVLFVDDEPRLLDGLRRQFRARRSNWSMRFAESGPEAMRLMLEDPADVVVTDMVMPFMTGADLLHSVSQQWPATARFILSGQTDPTELLSHIGTIHRFIQKPCQAEDLERIIVRTAELAQRLERGELRTLASRVRSLPVVTRTLVEMRQALTLPTCDADAVAKVVARDVGLSAKLLQLVSSAFFGMPRKVRSVKDAIVMLGLANVRQLAMASQAFDALAGAPKETAVIDQLWKASVDLSAIASTLARDAGCAPPACDAARIAGTLALVGRAILARGEPGRFARCLDESAARGTLLCDEEEREFGVPQQVIGAYALGLWGFEDPVVEAVAGQSAGRGIADTPPDHPARFLQRARSEFQALPLVERFPSSTDITPAQEAA